MKNVLNTPVTDGITRREGLLLTVLGSAMALAGCGGGGGGGSAGVSSGGTGSFSSGPIAGFGSIIVGGIRFEDATASSILDVDDDNRDMRGKLKLGMMVRVKGKPKNGDRADADSIEVRSELLGPIASIDASAKTLVVLGQTVQVTTTTIFEDGLTGLPALAVNDIVEVHGFVDPVTNRLTATRVERKLLASVKAFKLQGTISALDTTAKTFKIGTLTISFAAPVDIPAGLTLANGMLVRVRLEPVLTSGTRKALKIRQVEVEVEDRDEAEIEGTITAFTSSSKFSVNGQPVDATGVTVPAGLKLGDRVEVEGSLVNGVLVAKKVEREDENDPLKLELHGAIGSLNTTAKTFVLRGVTVDYSTTTDFRPAGKTAADLANGVSVEVKGVASADGTQLKAARISFE
ncbi:DUF5666 domain-containing protein [Polaromonas sp.]|uniref:DUF5666 domain-containing protein n=1 Tax=Polaromonas sp. TaxID=1869339 RepID=UPI00286B3883|nr:DUF5666 domain-containing protein [Polaromonas sp.]